MNKTYRWSEVDNEKLIELIKGRKPFVLTNVSSMSQSVKTLESLIEKKGYSCRIYTAGRKAAMAATFTPAAIWGLASAAAIAAHNLATINPDFEIAKYPLSDKIEVDYKK